jgi:hypothetical protein
MDFSSTTILVVKARTKNYSLCGHIPAINWIIHGKFITPEGATNMAIYAVDLRDRVIRRVSHRYHWSNNKRPFLIEASSAKQAWAKASRASGAIGSAVCAGCRHRHCGVCEECSATKQYSDYWICHCCSELNPRVQTRNGLTEQSNTT